MKQKKHVLLWGMIFCLFFDWSMPASKKVTFVLPKEVGSTKKISSDYSMRKKHNQDQTQCMQRKQRQQLDACMHCTGTLAAVGGFLVVYYVKQWMGNA